MNDQDQLSEALESQPMTRLNFFSKREMAELPNLLLPDEHILAVVSGTYTAGTAVLCVTSKRLLLVDKKFVRLNFEDVRFESVKEVNFSQQAFMASVKLFYGGREMQFRSWYKNELRILAQLLQQKMFETREKLHRSDEPQMVQFVETPTQQLIPQQPVRSTFPSVLNEQSSAQLEQYLSDRIARWRRASRFLDSLPVK